MVDNLIGTDITGKQGFGNAYEGVLHRRLLGQHDPGQCRGSQVISGNQVGVELNGSQATQNLVEGNFIGIDKTGLADLGNKNEGVLIEGARTIPSAVPRPEPQPDLGQPLGSPARRRRVRPGNLVEGNDIGTDITGTDRLGNEVDGVIFSNGASTTRSARRPRAWATSSLSRS